MSDRVWLGKVGALFLATAVMTAVIPLRSLEAQNRSTPPLLQQLVHSFDIKAMNQLL